MQDEIRTLPKKAKEDHIAKSAIICTTYGNIHITLFGDKCPKTIGGTSIWGKDFEDELHPSYITTFPLPYLWQTKTCQTQTSCSFL